MKPAEEILDALESTDDGYIHYSVLLPVITNLLSERDKARDKAIQDCIDIVFQEDGDFQQFIPPKTVLEKLEALKTNQLTTPEQKTGD